MWRSWARSQQRFPVSGDWACKCYYSTYLFLGYNIPGDEIRQALFAVKLLYGASDPKGCVCGKMSRSVMRSTRALSRGQGAVSRKKRVRILDAPAIVSFFKALDETSTPVFRFFINMSLTRIIIWYKFPFVLYIYRSFGLNNKLHLYAKILRRFLFSKPRMEQSNHVVERLHKRNSISQILISVAWNRGHPDSFQKNRTQDVDPMVHPDRRLVCPDQMRVMCNPCGWLTCSFFGVDWITLCLFTPPFNKSAHRITISQ